MKGILFRSDVWQGKLRALETYGKAVTRRLIPHTDLTEWLLDGSWTDEYIKDPDNRLIHLSRYHAGETVYVKEAYLTFRKDTEEESALRFNMGQNIKSVENLLEWAELPSGHGGIGILYKSDFGDWADNLDSDLRPWRSPLFLPERFARYFIQITDVRPERLQEITEEDALKEGVKGRSEYALLWDFINPKRRWHSNPWVFRYEFKEKER